MKPQITAQDNPQIVAGVRVAWSALVPVCLLLVLLGTGELFAGSLEDKMFDARIKANHGQNAEAVEVYETIVASPEAAPELKVQAFYRIIERHLSMRHVDEAVAATTRMRAAVKGIPDVARNSYIIAADVLWKADKKTEAIAKLEEFTQAFASQPADCAFMHMRAAGYYAAIGRTKDAAQEATKAIALDPANDKQVAQGLWYIQEAQWQAKDFDNCAQTLKQLMDPRYVIAANGSDQRNRYSRYADCLTRLKPAAQLQALYAIAAKQGGDPHFRQEMLMRIVGLLIEQNRLDEALAQCERVFTETPGCADFWYQAQQAIVDILRRQNRLAEAIQAQRIVLDVTGDATGVAAQCNQIAGMLKDLDKNVTRANAFIDFQTYGPWGKDGKPGDAAVLANPLAAVGYPSYGAREQAFAKAQAGGDDQAFARQRALMCMYTGHPDQAVKYYADALRRSLPANVMDIANEMIVLGVRGVHGHCLDLDRFYAFVRYGPAGLDGKIGTADDLKDPFAQLGVSPRKPTPDGGIVALPADQQKSLLELGSGLEALAGSQLEDANFQREVLWGLTRVHVALCDWGATGQAEFFEGLILSDRAGQIQTEAYGCAQAAARGGDLHLGGVILFWQAIEAKLDAGAFTKSVQARQSRAQFEATLRFFEKPPQLTPKLQPLK